MATYYWVGGDGTWDGSATANWSTSSGGAGGSGPPNNTDTVIFDSASGTGACTTASGSACAIATLNSSTLGLTLGADHTMSGTFTLTLGTLSLSTFTLTCNIFSSSNSNARSISFGTGNITLTGNNATIWTTATATNFSYTGTSAVNCTYSGSTGTRNIQGGQTANGGTESNALNFNITAGSDIVLMGASSRTYKNIDFTGFAGTLSNDVRVVYGNLTISSGMTLTAGANATTFAATSGTQQITTNGKTLDFPITQNSPGATVQLQDNLTTGSTRTFTLTAGTLDLSNGNRTLSAGLFSSNNSNTRSVAFGTGKIELTGNNATILAMGTVTNFTYTGTPTVNFTYDGSTGTRIIAFGGIAGATESNVLNFNYTSGTDSVNGVGSNSFVKNLNFTGFAGTLTNVASARNIYGNLTISSEMTVNASDGGFTFLATSGTQQITTNGITLDFPLTFSGIGGTFAFQDALTQGSTRAFTVTNGTIQLKNGVTSTVGSFLTSGTNQKFLQSTLIGNQATLSQASGTVTANYLTIRDINATGGAIWNAFVDQGNVDAGNVDGWDFGISPVVGGAEYTYALRSFTQPRRF